MTAENPHAGQGAVLLDIGGNVGALVVVMPEGFDDVEVEARPVGSDPHRHGSGDQLDHDHAPHDHDHDHGHGHEHEHEHLTHVAVVARPMGDRLVPSLVFGELAAGTYEFYVRPDGPVQLTATIRGGEVTEARWPD